MPSDSEYKPHQTTNRPPLGGEITLLGEGETEACQLASLREKVCQYDAIWHSMVVYSFQHQLFVPPSDLHCCCLLLLNSRPVLPANPWSVQLLFKCRGRSSQCQSRTPEASSDSPESTVETRSDMKPWSGLEFRCGLWAVEPFSLWCFSNCTFHKVTVTPVSGRLVARPLAEST